MTQTTDATQTLLLADGNPTTQRVVALAFAGEPVSVATASDADEVVLSLQRGVPDIVLADIGLTGTTGYEVAEYIRRDDRLSHVPVLLLAGAFDIVDRDKVAAAGVAGVVTKPFDPQALVERVRELLSGEARTASMVDGGPLSAPLGAPANAPVQAPAPRAERREAQSSERDTQRGDEVRLRLDESGELERPSGEARRADKAEASKAKADQRPPRPTPDRDRYFDQLDEAFAALAKTPREGVPSTADEDEEVEAPPAPAVQPAKSAAPAAGTPARAAQSVAPPAAASPSAASPAVAPPVSAPPAAAPLPASSASAQTATPTYAASATPAAAPVPSVPAVAPPSAAPQGSEAEPPRGGPAASAPRVEALGDAFAALLESEESGEPPDLLWPSDVPSGAGTEQAIARDLEPVVRRMLEQMTDRMLRETVSSVVAGAADRLVREEIERIKRHIK
ncbi:MAG: response regulator [Vicinamibacterales bacterium]